MMKHKTRAICLVFVLSGCGGGGGSGGSGIDPRLARLDIYEAQQLRVLGNPGAGVMAMPITEASNVPAFGTLLFDGSATIRVEHAALPLVLYGDATISLNFDVGTSTGTLDNFFGNNGDGAVVNYAGEIGMESLTAGQDLGFAYAGALSATGENLVFDGTMQGTLLGNPIGALVAADLEVVVDHNGTPVDATMIVISEVPVAP